MPVKLVHRNRRPAVAAPYEVPRMTREEILAAVTGRFSAGPATLEIIDSIVSKQHAADAVAARPRGADGNLSQMDQIDFEIYSKPLPGLFRLLGLYPEDAQ